MGFNSLSQRKLTANELRVFQEILSADSGACDIRLREGEYQYSLAKTIASFQLELYFPNVKDITRRLYGEEKANDVQFVRKIQTILKKMERSNVVKILPKRRPWELQRYVLSGFRFQDVDKNLVVFATDQQIGQIQNRLTSIARNQGTHTTKPSGLKPKVFALVLLVIISYSIMVWDFMQPLVNPIIFIPTFSIAVTCSLLLGKTLAQK